MQKDPNEVTQADVDAAFDQIYFEGLHPGETEAEYVVRRQMQVTLDEKFGLDPTPRVLGKPKSVSPLFKNLMRNIKT